MQLKVLVCLGFVTCVPRCTHCADLLFTTQLLHIFREIYTLVFKLLYVTVIINAVIYNVFSARMDEETCGWQ